MRPVETTNKIAAVVKMSSGKASTLCLPLLVSELRTLFARVNFWERFDELN
jgi:hypothetical protein